MSKVSDGVPSRLKTYVAILSAVVVQDRASQVVQSGSSMFVSPLSQEQKRYGWHLLVIRDRSALPSDRHEIAIVQSSKR